MAQRTINLARITKSSLVFFDPLTYAFTFGAWYEVGSQTTVTAGGVSTTTTAWTSQATVGYASYSGNAADISWGTDMDGGFGAGLTVIWTALKASIISQENLNIDGNAQVYNVDGSLMT